MDEAEAEEEETHPTDLEVEGMVVVTHGQPGLAVMYSRADPTDVDLGEVDHLEVMVHSRHLEVDLQLWVIQTLLELRSMISESFSVLLRVPVKEDLMISMNLMGKVTDDKARSASAKGELIQL